jgi:hypothetical protein
MYMKMRIYIYMSIYMCMYLNIYINTYVSYEEIDIYNVHVHIRI